MTPLPAAISKAQANRHSAAYVGLAGVTVAAAFASFGAWCRFSPDSFGYLGAARSLYETGHFAPERLAWPPGFSMVLAPLLAFGEFPLLACRWLSLACWAAAALLTFRLFEPSVGRARALVSAAIVAASPAILAQSTYLLSEPVFMPVSLACLVLAENWRNGTQLTNRAAALGGLLTGAAALIRTIGFALVPAMAAAILLAPRATLRRRLVGAAVFLATFTALPSAWHARQSAYSHAFGYGDIWTSARPSEDPSASTLRLFARRFVTFGPLRLADIKGALLPTHLLWRFFQPPLDRAASWLVGGLIVLAGLARLRAGRPTDIYCMFYLLVVAFWPWDEGPRLAVPLIPIFAAYVVQTATHPALFQHRRLAALTISILILYLLVQPAELVLANRALAPQRDKAQARLAGMRRLAAWQAENLAPDETLLAIVPRGDVARTTVYGSVYISRRRLSLLEAAPLLSETDLARFILARRAPSPPGWTAVGQVEGFTVFRRGESRVAKTAR